MKRLPGPEPLEPDTAQLASRHGRSGIAATDRMELRAEHPAHGTLGIREVALGAADATIRIVRDDG